jgi:hypothetical protein
LASSCSVLGALLAIPVSVVAQIVVRDLWAVAAPIGR